MIQLLKSINLWMLACIVGILCLGLYFGWNCKPQVKCPEIKAGVETLSIKVQVHDTTVKYIPRTQIKYIQQIARDTVFQPQSSLPVVQSDTSNCFSVEDRQNGAYIKASFCSQEFPTHKPLDLTGTIEYQPPTDSQRVLVRVDTVSRKPNLFWHDVKVAGVSVGVGIATGSILLLLLGR